MLRVVVNPSSGSALSPDACDEVAAALPEAEVLCLEEGESPVERAQAVPEDTTLLGVCGGDGTVAGVAGVALERGLPLVVFPGGTLNHFAGDLGLESMDDTAGAVAAGQLTHIDVGEIDGRLFLNNASIGAYPQLVDTRERYERYLGKWLALLVALVLVLRRGRPSSLEVDGRRRRVWLAWFGNCTYDIPGLVAGGRSNLDDGLLDIRLVHADRKYARLRLLVAILFRRLDRCGVYERHQAARVSVRVLGEGPAIRLAADGESFDGSPQFEVVKRPCALAVVSPVADREHASTQN